MMSNNKFFDELNRLVSDIVFEFDAYYHGENFESDLDKLLNSFECSIYKDTYFDVHLPRDERIKLKEEHLLKKLGAFALEGAGKGAMVTMASRYPPVITKAALAGAGLHAGKVAVIAGEILMSRFLGVVYINFRGF